MGEDYEPWATVTEPRDDAETAIAGLLAEHRYRQMDGEPAECVYGDWTQDEDDYRTDPHDAHRAHVASVIAAHEAAPDELTALREKNEKWAKDYMKVCHDLGGTELARQEIEAERDALRERIRALADEWEELTDEWFRDERRSYGRATQLHVWMEKKLRALGGDS